MSEPKLLAVVDAPEPEPSIAKTGAPSFHRAHGAPGRRMLRLGTGIIKCVKPRALSERCARRRSSVPLTIAGIAASIIYFTTPANAVCSWTTLLEGTTATATQVMNNLDCLATAASPSFTGTVGIGTSPTSDIVTIGDYSGNHTVVIGAGSTGWSSLYFGDGYGSDRYAGYVQYNHTSDFLAVGTSKLDRLIINSAGAVRFPAYGAGTLTTDSSGNIIASSDERLKKIEGKFSSGLSAIRGLEPVLYRWNADSHLDQSTEYAGFVAQNIQRFIPQAVGRGADGYLTLSDRPILAALVNGVKELDTRVLGLIEKSRSATSVSGNRDNAVKELSRLVFQQSARIERLEQHISLMNASAANAVERAHAKQDRRITIQ